MALIEMEKISSREEKFAELKRKKLLIDIDNMKDYLSRFSKKSTKPNPSFWEGKRVIVTGASGTVGSSIIKHLINFNVDMCGVVRTHSVLMHKNIQPLIKEGKLKIYEADLKDSNRVSNLIKDFQPHVIFHQAAESSPPTSVDQPAYVTENNCLSTVNILEAVSKNAKEIEAVQLACSSEQYGFTKSIDELPVKETNELRPTSPYAATKVFTEYIGKSYYYMYKIPVKITRTFNQEGLHRPRHFFTGNVSSQIAECLMGSTDKMIIGNPNAVRDMTHVLDSSAAQILAAEKCSSGEAYNICSGIGIITGDFAKLAARTFGLSNIKIYVDEKRLRPYERNEVLFDGFIGDNSKFCGKTGWLPERSVIDIINDGVNFYKAEASR